MGAKTEATEYEFGAPSRLTGVSRTGLQKIHQTFADGLATAYSKFLGTEVRSVGVEIKEARHDSFVEAVGGGFFVAMTAGGLSGDVQVGLPKATAVRLLNLLLGLKDLDDERSLTPVDTRILLLPSVVELLRDSFKPYYPLDLCMSEVDNEPLPAGSADGQSQVLLVELSLLIDDEAVNLFVCYPREVLAPVLSRIAGKARDASSAALSLDTEIARSMRTVTMQATVELPSWSMEAQSLADLAVGDIIQTGIDVSNPPLFCVAGEPVFRTRPTTRRSRVAVEVLGLVNER